MIRPLQNTTKPDAPSLSAALKRRDDEQLLQLLAGGSGRVVFDVDDVVEVLRQTTSDRVRNAAAMALVDHHATQALDALVDVLGRQQLAGSAGTLVYALNELGGLLPSRTFLMLLEHGSFEARAESLALLERDGITFPSRAEQDAVQRRLAPLTRSANADMAAHASLALTWLASAGADTR